MQNNLHCCKKVPKLVVAARVVIVRFKLSVFFLMSLLEPQPLLLLGKGKRGARGLQVAAGTTTGFRLFWLLDTASKSSLFSSLCRRERNMENCSLKHWDRRKSIWCRSRTNIGIEHRKYLIPGLASCACDPSNKGRLLDLMSCCLRILGFLNKGPTVSFCTGSSKLCSQSYLMHLVLQKTLLKRHW